MNQPSLQSVHTNPTPAIADAVCLHVWVRYLCMHAGMQIWSHTLMSKGTVRPGLEPQQSSSCCRCNAPYIFAAACSNTNRPSEPTAARQQQLALELAACMTGLQANTLRHCHAHSSHVLVRSALIFKELSAAQAQVPWLRQAASTCRQL